MVKKTVTICYAVFIWYRNVTDRRKDRRTDKFAISISRVSMLTRDKNALKLIILRDKNDFFFLEGPIRFHHTPTTLDTYGASPLPYWNLKYATGLWPPTILIISGSIFMSLVHGWRIWFCRASAAELSRVVSRRFIHWWRCLMFSDVWLTTDIRVYSSVCLCHCVPVARVCLLRRLTERCISVAGETWETGEGAKTGDLGRGGMVVGRNFRGLSIGYIFQYTAWTSLSFHCHV